jgi:hypothetical protein
MAPVGPDRLALLTRSAGRGVVSALVSGPMGVGAASVIGPPTVNLNGSLNEPVPPGGCARARQK